MSSDQTSIQRFLQNRATQIIVTSQLRTGNAWQIAIGIACTLIGAGLLIAGLISGVFGLKVGSIGPLVAGVINLGIGIAFRRRSTPDQIEVKLTPEARGFLQDLMRQTNTQWGCGTSWGSHRAWQQSNSPLKTFAGENSIFHQLGKHWGFIPKTPKDVLPKPVHDMLDIACFHYNRVYGILESGKTDSGITKVANTARAGADEALFTVLHHAATMHRYPETTASASRDCDEKIRALKEMADGLEKIKVRPTSISDRLGYTSAMDSALEEIRLEQLAREELRTHRSDDEQHLRDRL
ncbi:MAG: hypothetical protein BGO01_06425 [Armatimonadetes bacterium 55-13]|nr:hypothetical protein [Armatimonadota bacterium]OJU65114.1 MAG: hypothetical protein BGO01_06425 [Armatimonadetes bacterium 55-13]